MDLRCDDVRELLEASGPSTPLSEERAEQVAEHLDRCPDCDERLGRKVADLLGSLPVTGGPSIPAVRTLIREDLRRSTIFRISGLAAAALALAGTGWALLHQEPGTARVADRRAPVEAPLPDPPKLADLNELDRNIIRSEGVLALYLQFCLTCLNTPTDQDKQEYLTRSLLMFREIRGRIRSQLERGGATVEAVTLDALNDALRMIATSRLPSVTLAPTQAQAFKFLPSGDWQVDHLLARKNYRLTLHALPDYLNFAYLKIALGANDPLMARVEEALWTDTFVALPKRMEDRDPSIAPKSLDTVLPLLLPRQQTIYRKIVGAP